MLTTSFHNQLFTSILIATFSPTITSGQARTFTNKSVDYVIEFPSTRWRALPSSGIVPPRTRKAFMYADGNVRLLVRRKFVDADVTPSEMVHRRQRWAQQLAGYVSGKEEPFSGRLDGAKFSYEYVRGGKTISAVIYYLETDNRTIYSLLFRGPRDELRSIGNQTDSMARSFRLKNSRRS
ncbi:MAG TPA: hypothetical protein VIV66_14520 [Pyrinomonadaceae bacterium]